MREVNILLVLILIVFASLMLLIILDNILLNNKINDLESRTGIAFQSLLNDHGGSIKGLCSLHPECEWIEPDPEPKLEGML